MQCVLIVISLLGMVSGSFLSRIFGGKSSSAHSSERDELLLPKVIPSPDKSYLVSFVSDDYDHCEQMEPVLKRLEDDLGTVIRRIDIARRREFMGLLEAMGHNDCGTLPFYYNRRTGQAVCGATTYVNLRRWGTGDLRHSFSDPPESLMQPDDNYIGPSSRRSVGTKGFLLDKLQGLERRGRDRAEKVKQVEQLRKERASKKAAQKTTTGKTVKADKKSKEAVTSSVPQNKKQSAAERTAARRAARQKV